MLFKALAIRTGGVPGDFSRTSKTLLKCSNIHRSDLVRNKGYQCCPTPEWRKGIVLAQRADPPLLGNNSQLLQAEISSAHFRGLAARPRGGVSSALTKNSYGGATELQR